MRWTFSCRAERNLDSAKLHESGKRCRYCQKAITNGDVRAYNDPPPNRAPAIYLGEPEACQPCAESREEPVTIRPVAVPPIRRRKAGV